ncbi:MAG: hypothetical protein GY809_11585, partial [Planctomycetes bacterium]|nr:hypothetical protein [Planctomycetota bacterium]
MMHNLVVLVMGLVIGLGLPVQEVRANQTPDQAEEPAWSVGYGEADITPGPMQVQMSGYG